MRTLPKDSVQVETNELRARGCVLQLEQETNVGVGNCGQMKQLGRFVHFSGNAK